MAPGFRELAPALVGVSLDVCQKVIERRCVFQHHREAAGAAGVHPQAVRVGVLCVTGKTFNDVLPVLRPQDHDVRLAGLPVAMITVRVDAFIGVADGLRAGRLAERNDEQGQFDKGE